MEHVDGRLEKAGERTTVVERLNTPSPTGEIYHSSILTGYLLPKRGAGVEEEVDERL